MSDDGLTLNAFIGHAEDACRALDSAALYTVLLGNPTLIRKLRVAYLAAQEAFNEAEAIRYGD